MQAQSTDAAAPDTLADIVRALVLYSLAEYQSGHATEIRVRAEGWAFEVSDNGRGHALERTVAGLPYMRLVYTHLDFPFAQTPAPPVQLHTLGASFINTLCSRLVVTVHKRGSRSRSTYHDGRHMGDETFASGTDATGTAIAGTLRRHLQERAVDGQRLMQWLGAVAAASPGLALYFNDLPVPPHNGP
jgi:DNA gyrase/topoisomerase IV subunit B